MIEIKKINTYPHQTLIGKSPLANPLPYRSEYPASTQRNQKDHQNYPQEDHRRSPSLLTPLKGNNEKDEYEGIHDDNNRGKKL